MIRLFLLILSGLCSGVLGGMGMGGGTILIPMLTIFFSLGQHLSQAVNLISFMPMSIVAIIIHAKNKLIKKRKLWLIIIPAVICGFLFSMLAKKVDGKILQKIFGGFLLILSCLQFFSKSK